MTRFSTLNQSLVSLAALALAAAACSAGTDDSGAGPTSGGGGSGAAGGSGANVSDGGNGGSGASTDGAGGDGGGFIFDGGGGQGGEGGGPPINPCGTECLPPGSDELCDGIHKGLDDNCNGEVDEGCSCSAGQASSCFKGDPSYRDDPGCNAGTMSCGELGLWGPCIGGNHATENCFSNDTMGCHPINGVPFQTVDVEEGTGNFNDNADPGSETYTVACPQGVVPCPTLTGTDYSPLQSGEYTVTYTKEVNGVEATCNFPLYIGARGLRVELSWNFQGLGGSSVDLDLHMKQPMNTGSWNVGFSGAPNDCGWGNCHAPDWAEMPNWFNGVAPPDPVNWYEDPDPNLNTCYFAPRGIGQDWMDHGEGCHNPRLDLDNISCNATVTDPQASNFCAPENINIDFPPKNQWMRIGVHHFSHSATPNVLPNVKIFCDGALAADLGTKGYYVPETAFSWSAAADSKKMWLVADVLFREDECVKECIVEPLYIAPAADRRPVVLTEAQATSQNGPPYPAVPD